MMLRVADEGGRISLGPMSPSEAVVRLCGAAGRERRWLRKNVAELLEARAFVVEGGSLVVTDWASQMWPDAGLPPFTVDACNGQSLTTNRSLIGQSLTTNRSVIDQSLTTNRSVIDQSNAPKPSESLGGSATYIIEEEYKNNINILKGGPVRAVTGHTGERLCESVTPQREEKRKEEKTLSPALSRRPDDLTDAAVVRGVVEQWLSKIGQPTNLGGFSSQTLINESLGSLRAVAESEGVSLDRATGRTLLGFEEDDWAKAHGYPLGAWARRPAKYLPLWRQANEKRERARRLAELESQSEEVSFGTEEERLSPEETTARVGEILGNLGNGFSMGAA